MARTRHGLGKRLALRLITVAGLAAAAWALAASPANAVLEPSGTVGDGLFVPVKPIPDSLRETPGRLRISVAEDADPISSIVAPVLSPALDLVIALTEPVVRAVEPVGRPLLAHAFTLREVAGAAFAATLEPVLFDDGAAERLIGDASTSSPE